MGAIAYNYDAADNLTQLGSTSQGFNNADELCWTATTSGSCASPPTGATTYAYDARGNRTKVTPPSGGATNLSYDQANRLTAYGSFATYAYNGDGLRMSKTVSGTTSQFLWDVAPAVPLLLKDGSTAYVHGPGGLPLEQINGSTVLWLHHDQLGSTRLVTDTTGASQATYMFDPYGNITASTGTITNPMRFAGQYRDGESSFYYLRARYYDPSTGQFLSRDPALAGTREAYAYIADNPLNGTDPSGLYNCGWQVWNCITNPFADPAQGNRNFVDNFSNGGWIWVVGPLTIAGGIAAFGLGSAAAGALGIGGAAAALNEAEQVAPGEAACSQGQLNWAQNILNQGGQNALLKSQASIQAQLAAHEAKLAQIQAAGGYTSSVEREISNFQGQLNAIQRLQNQ